MTNIQISSSEDEDKPVAQPARRTKSVPKNKRFFENPPVPKSAIKNNSSKPEVPVEGEFCVMPPSSPSSLQSPRGQVSMISMRSEKIAVGGHRGQTGEFEIGIEGQNGTRKTYIFNGYTVEETYAGPGES